MKDKRYSGGGGEDLPVTFRGMVMFLELMVVIALGTFSANFLLSFMGGKNQIPSGFTMISPDSPVRQSPDQKPPLLAKYNHLLGYDPFFGGPALLTSSSQTEAPESNLNITVFGMRYQRAGESSVIVKIQGQDQIRAIAGDSLSPNVRLVGIYEERIEITRNGARESVYFHVGTQRRNKLMTTKPTVKADRALIATLLKKLELTILRSGKGVDGFVIGAGANKLFLAAVQLERGDLLVSVNGEPLSSYERIEELPDEINGATYLNIDLVRRGIAKQHVVPLDQLIGK